MRDEVPLEADNAASEEAGDLLEPVSVIHVPRVGGIVAQVHRHRSVIREVMVMRPSVVRWVVAGRAVNRGPLLDTYADESDDCSSQAKLGPVPAAPNWIAAVYPLKHGPPARCTDDRRDRT